MIDVYKIGATLVLNDLIAPQLLKLASEFRKVDALAANVNRHLAQMDSHVAGIRSLARASGTMANNMGRANTEAAQLARSMNAVHAAGVAASRSAFIGQFGPGGGGGGRRPPVPPGPVGFNPIPPRRQGAGGAGGAAGGGGGFGGHGGNVHVG